MMDVVQSTYKYQGTVVPVQLCAKNLLSVSLYVHHHQHYCHCNFRGGTKNPTGALRCLSQLLHTFFKQHYLTPDNFNCSAAEERFR